MSSRTDTGNQSKSNGRLDLFTVKVNKQGKTENSVFRKKVSISKQQTIHEEGCDT